MSAEVAVINTQGVAIAADSAVTITTGSGRKTYYTAQKIFNLSREHFTGIMIYGDTEFMGINWEIIINEFSKKIGDRVYDSLKGYADYFLTFLRDFIDITDDSQKKLLEYLSYWFFKIIKDEYDKDITKNYPNQEITKPQQSKVLSGVIKKTRDILEKTDDYIHFTDDGFIKTNRAVVVKEMEEVLADFTISDKVKEELIELLVLDIAKMAINFWEKFHSGIAFAGYGNDEIFPSVISIELFGKLGKNVLNTEFDISDLIHDSNAWITPFAQADAMRMFLRGIDPGFKGMIIGELRTLAEKIINETGKKNAEGINSQIDELIQKIENHEENEFKAPVMNVVASLPKSNLAEMAEALVNLTALRQHVSSEEQTVGGPTDVALITKTDGFVWIKKKQLFQIAQDNRR